MMPGWFAHYLRRLPNDQAAVLWDWLSLGSVSPQDAVSDIVGAIRPNSRWRAPARCWRAATSGPEVIMSAVEPSTSVELLSPSQVAEYVRLRAKMEEK